MSEISGQTSLAILEERPQRPGGCVGIFFQLFDWNKRFAKKKLFPKKLLPPVPLRKLSKKFGGDEKQPKLRLIADENSGGFPHGKKNEGSCNVHNEQRNEMQTAGLVARLMGLESMPAAQDKSKKALLHRTGSDKGENFVNSHGRYDGEELIVGKGEITQELRPQKVQKTGLSERKPVTRFGAEALQLKNVLSRSRKHHQRLVSPVKSPRNVSGRNAARLIGAVTRILEPGLQRSKSKCALTYSHAVHHPPAADAFLEEAIHLEPFQNASYFQTSAKPLKGQLPCCRNCSHSLDISAVRPNAEEQQPVLSPVSQFVNTTCQMLERDNRGLPIFCPELERGKLEEDSQSYAAFAMQDRQTCAGYMPDPKREVQRQWQSTSQQSELQKDVSTTACLWHKTHEQNHMFQVRDRLPSRSKVNKLQRNRVSAAANASNGTKDFVLFKQSLSCHSQLTVPPKEDSCRLDTDRKIKDKGHDSPSSMRKRSTTNCSRHNDGSSFVSCSFAKPNNIRASAISGKDRCSTSHSNTRSCTNNRLAHLQRCINADSGRSDSDAISFTFKSPMKSKTGIHADVEARRNPNGSIHEVSLKKSVLDESKGKKDCLKSFPLSGDILGALLEQKLKELTCEEEDSVSGDATPKKSNSVICQELISALTAERQCHQNELAHGVNNRESYLHSDNQQYKENISLVFQSKTKSTKTSTGYLSNGEHLSPGSVLDTSFSNDSCASSSLDDGSRPNLGIESTYCCEGQQLLEPDADLLDSACSLSMGKFYREPINNLLNIISEVFTTINLPDLHLRGSKLTHAKEAILNAELVFGNAALPSAVANGGFSISHFVLDELELLASIMWMNFRDAFGSKDGNQLKGFVFDCVIEYLESRFARCSNSGFSPRTRLPLSMKTEMFICVIVEEVGKWAELAGLMPDELIEHEMSHSLGKWIDFDLEAFETGVEIDQQILQSLIAEAVVDFTCCNQVCC